MDLQQEIDMQQRSLKTDHLTMSLGELMRMYVDRELVINPQFQRLFRWTREQKSRLIESILLGIPIPSLFTYETAESRWELVDGLQRMSTVLEFAGDLRDPVTDKKLPPSVLTAGRYLKGLENAVWELNERTGGLSEEPLVEIGRPLQLAIRHCRIGLEILKRPSDINTKYDLFQRLNSGGTGANPQELRNCAVVMVNPEFFEELRSLSNGAAFGRLVKSSEAQHKAQKELEYLMRFLVYRYVPYDGKKDVEEYVTDGIVELATSRRFGADEKANFLDTFRLLEQTFGQDALRGSRKVGFTGLEVIAVGISFNLTSILKRKDPAAYISERRSAFWESDAVARFTKGGLRGTQRIKDTIPFGKTWFAG